MTVDGTRSMTARTPEDLLAAVPVVLGFHPQDSLVMLTVGSLGRPFHARVDLPGDPSPASVAGAVAPLRAAATSQGVRQAAFVLYTPDRAVAAAVAAALDAVFADVGVLGVMRVDGGRWRTLTSSSEGPPVAYDVGLHDFALEAVVEGTVVHRDRASLAATVARDPRGSVVVARAAVALPPLGRGGVDVAEEVGWAVALLGAVGPGDRASDTQVARLIRLLGHLDARDQVWLSLSLARAPVLVPWWSDVVRRTPETLVAAPACLLGFVAWQAGQGALAWCAVDRCTAVEPEHSGAALVAALLDRAVPPSDWEEMGLTDDPG